eukprot:6213006-Pleurochrysis_carterae.AAC.4
MHCYTSGVHPLFCRVMRTPYVSFQKRCSVTANLPLTSLRIAVLLGSTRTDGPPRPSPLGSRVGAFVTSCLEARGHSVDVVDAIVQDLPLLKKPHFAYAKGKAPANLEGLYKRLSNADAYVAVTPEYNHAPSPALLNLVNHFGSSTFSFKPSAIVSYSAGQWGGTRAAHALRPVLSELGCLPVSAMVHVPRAQTVLDSNGTPIGGDDAVSHWQGYAARTWYQLEWWGSAAAQQRATVDPFSGSPAMVRSPEQRDAPRSEPS